MANYSIYVLGANHVTLGGGLSLGHPTQGFGEHLQGASITLESRDWQEVHLTDDDRNFDDNDTSQRLNGSVDINGRIYANGMVVEAEYVLTLQDAEGKTYKVVGFNINEGNPGNTYATIEGLAFLGPPGAWPPVGVPLTVIGYSEGPGYAGVPSTNYDDYVRPICFVSGTLIDTPEGPRPVEELRTGDLVMTADAGARPLIWTGQTRVGGTLRDQLAAFRPVRIEAGALDGTLPERDLLVSQQHRILLRGASIELQFGHPEVLVPAHSLLGRPGISEDAPEGAWSFHHLLLDAHHVLSAEGLPCESLLPGPEALGAMAPQLRAEVAALLGPQLAGSGYAPVRPLLRRWEGRLAA